MLKKREPSSEHEQAHKEIVESYDHEAKSREAHGHGAMDFIRLLVATIMGQEIGDDET